jgi:chromosome segregation ATPase
MTLPNIGLASVLAGLGLLLLLCSVLTWRMLRRLRDSQEDMGALAHSLRSQATLLNRTAGEALETFGHLRKETHRLLASARADQGTAAATSTPSEDVEHLRQELQKAQDRARKTEVENCELAASLDRQKARNGNGPEVAADPVDAGTALREMADKLAEADADRQRLRRQLDQIQDNLTRTLTEKEFIEDKFLELDASQGGPEAPTKPAAEARDETFVEV